MGLDLSGSLRTLYIRCRDWNLALASCTFYSGEKSSVHSYKRQLMPVRSNILYLVSGILVWMQLQSELPEGPFYLILYGNKNICLVLLSEHLEREGCKKGLLYLRSRP